MRGRVTLCSSLSVKPRFRIGAPVFSTVCWRLETGVIAGLARPRGKSDRGRSSNMMMMMTMWLMSASVDGGGMWMKVETRVCQGVIKVEEVSLRFD
jgi:hypothetical protein